MRERLTLKGLSIYYIPKIPLMSLSLLGSVICLEEIFILCLPKMYWLNLEYKSAVRVTGTMFSAPMSVFIASR